MKGVLPVLAIFAIGIFLFGCSKEEAEVLGPITGEAYKIDEIIKEETAEEEIPDEEIEDYNTVRLCYDSDNGIVRWVNGTVFGFDNKARRFEFRDFCFDPHYLVEYYCDEDQIPQNFTFLCVNGCSDNHCQ